MHWQRKMFKAGLYIRLSKEDKNESIKNQQSLLLNFAKNMHFDIGEIYIDDGYTGTNFNRPAFKKMINDIKHKKINMVIVKDLSRLGRDYIKTGEYVEHFFPINNIRFIAITDNIDTFIDNANNDIAPFKAIINDLYAKDLSKKIRTAIKTMQLNGLWTGGCLPLGYKKDDSCKNKIIINEDEAKIVRQIFTLFYEGQDLSEIKNELEKQKVPTFSKIRFNKDNKWTEIAIKKILTNQIYVGDLIQNKHQRLSYKYRKIIRNSSKDWIICKNNHQAIVSRKIFNSIQDKLIYNESKKDNPRLFDGLLYCFECKHHIGIRNKNKMNRSYMCCNYYRANYKQKLCSAHAFNYDELEENVLDIIKGILKKVDYKKIKEKTKVNNELLSKLLNLEIYTEELIKVLIERIEITKDKEVIIFLNFKLLQNK